VRYDASAGKLVKKSAKDAKNGPITDSGNYTFGGLEDNFFAAVALPVDSASLEIRTYSDQVKTPGEDKSTVYVGDGVSTGTQNDFSLYVGPKDIDILRQVNPKLAQLVDWGFFGILAKPLFLSLNWVHDHWTNNYGWAIILVTLIINVLLFPFKLTSLKSARKMQKLQPQIQAINAKYKDISISDPRKAEQNQEVMALYKKEGVNPLGGCLPTLLPLPVFFIIFRLLERLTSRQRHQIFDPRRVLNGLPNPGGLYPSGLTATLMVDVNRDGADEVIPAGVGCDPYAVIPAKAGIQANHTELGACGPGCPPSRA